MYTTASAGFDSDFDNKKILGHDHILKDYNKTLKTSNSNPTCIGFMIMLGLESINTTISIILISLHQTWILKFVKWSKIVLIFLCRKLIPIIMLSFSSFEITLFFPYFFLTITIWFLNKILSSTMKFWFMANQNNWFD